MTPTRDRYAVLDTETTGLDPREGAELVELAAVVSEPLEDETEPPIFSELIRPERPIPPAAMAVHHITPDMVSSARDPALVVQDCAAQLRLGGSTFLVAHNARFDRQFLAAIPGPWICTWRCALHLWPEMESHSNQYLRYALGLMDVGAPATLHPHRALYDVLTTQAILREMLRGNSLGHLYDLTSRPAVLHTCRFGKYRGRLWQDVPRDYMQWCLRQEDMDEDVHHTCRHWLSER